MTKVQNWGLHESSLLTLVRNRCPRRGTDSERRTHMLTPGRLRIWAAVPTRCHEGDIGCPDGVCTLDGTAALQVNLDGTPRLHGMGIWMGTPPLHGMGIWSNLEWRDVYCLTDAACCMKTTEQHCTGYICMLLHAGVCMRVCKSVPNYVSAKKFGGGPPQCVRPTCSAVLSCRSGVGPSRHVVQKDGE